MADFLSEIFEQFSPEEQARLRAAEASANAVLANGDAEVRSCLRFAGSLDDRNWLLQPQDDARANAAGIVFVSYVNALWVDTNRARAESILAFLGNVDKLIPPVLNKYGAWESRAMISELRAECERGAWRVHAGLRRDADMNATYTRHSRSDGHGAGRQEDLLKDARAWAEEEMRELSVDVEDTAELQRRVAKRTWDEFVPRHRYHSDFHLGYREFASALWKEGLPSLEELATMSFQEHEQSPDAQESVPPSTTAPDPFHAAHHVHSDDSGSNGVGNAAMPDPKSDVDLMGRLSHRLAIPPRDAVRGQRMVLPLRSTKPIYLNPSRRDQTRSSLPTRKSPRSPRRRLRRSNGESQRRRDMSCIRTSSTRFGPPGRSDPTMSQSITLTKPYFCCLPTAKAASNSTRIPARCTASTIRDW